MLPSFQLLGEISILDGVSPPTLLPSRSEVKVSCSPLLHRPLWQDSLINIGSYGLPLQG